MRGVLRQQRMQERGAGAWQTDDEDRLPDLLFGNAGIALPLRYQLQSRAQGVDEATFGAKLPERIERRLVAQRIGKNRQRLVENSRTPVGETGGLLGGIHEARFV